MASRPIPNPNAINWLVLSAVMLVLDQVSKWFDEFGNCRIRRAGNDFGGH